MSYFVRQKDSKKPIRFTANDCYDVVPIRSWDYTGYRRREFAEYKVKMRSKGDWEVVNYGELSRKRDGNRKAIFGLLNTVWELYILEDDIHENLINNLLDKYIWGL